MFHFFFSLEGINGTRGVGEIEGRCGGAGGLMNFRAIGGWYYLYTILEGIKLQVKPLSQNFNQQNKGRAQLSVNIRFILICCKSPEHNI